LNLVEYSDWTWPAFVLAFLLAGTFLVFMVFAGRLLYRRLFHSHNQRVNPEYFKGLNFLLNEETDKAIEVFIKALEVDSETVELHLALGGLFRRKGQVDRATRIHQNLVARSNLSDDQRMQAVHELAQDYYKAGWLDRAENLFEELKESDNYRVLALNGLCRIYQQEKEWQQAINVLRQHRRSDRADYATQVAHYFCEIAELAIQNSEFEAARRALKNAYSESSSVARVDLLQGQLNYAEGRYNDAVTCWNELIASHPSLSQLVVGKMIRCYQNLHDDDGLRRYLLELSTIPKDENAFQLWRSALTEMLGQKAAIEHIFTQVRQQGLSAPVANFLFNSIDSNKLSEEFRASLLGDLLSRAKNRKIEYTCIGCGFDTRAMYWFCPNCGEWESFR